MTNLAFIPQISRSLNLIKLPAYLSSRIVMTPGLPEVQRNPNTSTLSDLIV
jgi:hypothetical protein